LSRNSYYTLIQRIIPDIEFHQNRYARELDACVGDQIRWLDLGCGVQIHSGWVGPTEQATRARAAYLVGCDLDLGHLRANQLLSARVGADAERLPFADGSFDLVSANMVLEHLREPARVFQEVARVLAPGGAFVFVTPNRWHPAIAALSLIVAPRWRRFLAHSVEGRPLEHIFLTFYRANSTATVRRHAQSAGLVPERLDTFSSYPMFPSPRLLVFLECLVISAMRCTALSRFRSNLVGVLRKPKLS